MKSKLVDNAIPSIHDESVKRNCPCAHIQSFSSPAFKYQFFSQVQDIGTSLITIRQINHYLFHFASHFSIGSLPYSGTIIQTQIPSAWFKLLFSHFFVLLLLVILSVRNVTIVCCSTCLTLACITTGTSR